MEEEEDGASCLELDVPPKSSSSRFKHSRGDQTKLTERREVVDLLDDGGEDLPGNRMAQRRDLGGKERERGRRAQPVSSRERQAHSFLLHSSRALETHRGGRERFGFHGGCSDWELKRSGRGKQGGGEEEMEGSVDPRKKEREERERDKESSRADLFGKI